MQVFYEHVLSLPAAFHGEAHSGRLMKVMLSGADAIFWLWLSIFRDQLATFLAVAVLLPLTLLLNWRLAIALIVLVALFCAVTLLVVKRTEAGQQRAQDWQIRLAGTAQDTIANVTLVQSFSRMAAETRLFGEMMAQVIRHQFPVLNWWALVNVLTRGASTMAVIAIVVIGAWLHMRGQASVGEIVSFMGLATLLIGRLESAMVFSARLFFELPNFAAYFEVLDTQNPVLDNPEAPALRQVFGEVAFDHVSFAYPTAPAVLRDVSFRAEPGEVIALVGPTGAGKSTAIALLQRIWDPDRGHILIDGQDLRHVSLASVRQNIGVVFQDSLLFNRSIRDNLMIGKPDATEAELEAACQQAEAHDFILRQPQGYDTMVGERGASLSGGQRQRLAIARALLKNPPILILDEATSALDAATEARVTRALRALMAGRTTFVIAHRLSTVRDADVILVMSEGRIVERGNFTELLAGNSLFADLVATQLAPAL
jgi:ATP-binding cassette subfamily B protein